MTSILTQPTAIKLGSRVKDPVTGFEGIAVGRTEWLWGCTRIGVDAEKLDEKGKFYDTQWFDEARLLVVQEAAVAGAPAPLASVGTGGPDRGEPSNRRPGE